MNFNMQKLLGLLKKQGYDEIRFPGGKSRDGSIAAFGAIVRASIIDSKIIHEVLVVPYRLMKEGDLEKDNLPDEPVFSETATQTLEREINEETGVLINKGQYYEMGVYKVDDRRDNRVGEKHPKHAYVIYDYDLSNIRRTPSPFQRNTGFPFWIRVNDLELVISVHHRWILTLLKSNLPHLPVKKFQPFTFGKKFRPGLVA